MPKVLFISPISPGGYKNGLSKRAEFWLSVLSKKYEVYLLVIPIADGRISECQLDYKKSCSQIHIAKLPWHFKLKRWMNSIYNFNLELEKDLLSDKPFITKATASFKDISFDAIHVLRIYLANFAESFLCSEQPTSTTLDLDDIESITNQRLGELCLLRNKPRLAKNYFTQSSYFKNLEETFIKRFNKVFVTSRTDQEKLTSYGYNNLFVVPNSINESGLKITELRQSEVFSFIFVGNFEYLPNQDAIYWLIAEILPTLKKITDKKFIINLIGSGNLPNIKKLKEVPEIKIIQNTENLIHYYLNSDAAIIPLRAGGGTRIKIIEAFAYKVPIVSTTIGVEGLDVDNNTHALIADDTKSFAENCFKLMNSDKLRKTLADNAFELFYKNYTSKRATETVLALI